ncbi:hypothetical protein D3C72_2555170 [compost metagenome]
MQQGPPNDGQASYPTQANVSNQPGVFQQLFKGRQVGHPGDLIADLHCRQFQRSQGYIDVVELAVELA